MSKRKSTTLIYRLLVLILAAGYAVYHIVFGNYDVFAGPMRFLTFWALCLSVLSGFAVLRLSLGARPRGMETLGMCTAVLNTMVLILYWRLYFIDPNLVNSDNVPNAWWNEYYLHGVGPLLQIFEALFLSKVFRRPVKAIVPLVVLVLVYVTFGEVLVQNFADFPVGRVTSGLPYPFLNNMEFPARAMYYGQNMIVAIVLLFLYAGIGWIIRLLSRTKL